MDLVGDRRRNAMEFLGRAGEAAAPLDRVDDGQRLQGQSHGDDGSDLLMNFVQNIRYPGRDRQRSIVSPGNGCGAERRQTIRRLE
jgi:hypothetical protein